MVLFDEPLTINPMEVMRDESTWTSILRPDKVPIPYTSFTTPETAVSHDPNFDYRTPSFQHLSNVLDCSGFQLTASEQTYLLSAIAGTKPAAPRPTTPLYHPTVLSGRIYKPQAPRRPSRPLSLREPRTPSDEDAHNPFASLAPVHHSLGPKEIPRFYGMRMTAQECDLLETMLGETTTTAGGSPMPSLSWSEGEEADTVSPVDVFGGSGGGGVIQGIAIPSDEEEEEGEERKRSRSVCMDGDEREKYEAQTAPIRAYSWKGRMSSSRRSSTGI